MQGRVQRQGPPTRQAQPAHQCTSHALRLCSVLRGQRWERGCGTVGQSAGAETTAAGAAATAAVALAAAARAGSDTSSERGAPEDGLSLPGRPQQAGQHGARLRAWSGTGQGASGRTSEQASTARGRRGALSLLNRQDTKPSPRCTGTPTMELLNGVRKPRVPRAKAMAGGRGTSWLKSEARCRTVPSPACSWGAAGAAWLGSRPAAAPSPALPELRSKARWRHLTFTPRQAQTKGRMAGREQPTSQRDAEAHFGGVARLKDLKFRGLCGRHRALDQHPQAVLLEPACSGRVQGGQRRRVRVCEALRAGPAGRSPAAHGSRDAPISPTSSQRVNSPAAQLF